MSKAAKYKDASEKGHTFLTTASRKQKASGGVKWLLLVECYGFYSG